MYTDSSKKRSNSVILKDGTNKAYNSVCICLPKTVIPDEVLKGGLVTQTG